MMHGHNHIVSRKRLFWTIIFNIGITLAEVIGGLITGYLALLADAIHNLSDVAALGLAWLGVKGAELPATKKSTYGCKRIEVMTAFISAVSLVVIAVFILLEAYRRFIDPHPIGQPGLFLTVAFIGLIGNVLSIWLLHSEKGKSLNMKTAFLHMAYDAVSSVAVIAGGIVIVLTGWLTVDVVLSTIIALMIFWSSWAVIKEAVLILMEAVPSGVDFDDVARAIAEVDGVKDLHDLHIWSLSSTEAALSCHVCVEQDNFNSGPRITAEINRMLAEEFDIGHGTVQLEVEKCMRGDLLCFNSEDMEHKQE